MDESLGLKWEIPTLGEAAPDILKGGRTKDTTGTPQMVSSVEEGDCNRLTGG